jgi:hypothetical protein
MHVKTTNSSLFTDLYTTMNEKFKNRWKKFFFLLCDYDFCKRLDVLLQHCSKLNPNLNLPHMQGHKVWLINTVVKATVRLAQFVERWTLNPLTRVRFPDGAGPCNWLWNSFYCYSPCTSAEVFAEAKDKALLLLNWLEAYPGMMRWVTCALAEFKVANYCDQEGRVLKGQLLNSPQHMNKL